METKRVKIELPVEDKKQFVLADLRFLRSIEVGKRKDDAEIWRREESLPLPECEIQEKKRVLPSDVLGLVLKGLHKIMP